MREMFEISAKSAGAVVPIPRDPNGCGGFPGHRGTPSHHKSSTFMGSSMEYQYEWIAIINHHQPLLPDDQWIIHGLLVDCP